MTAPADRHAHIEPCGCEYHGGQLFPCATHRPGPPCDICGYPVALCRCKVWDGVIGEGEPWPEDAA